MKTTPRSSRGWLLHLLVTLPLLAACTLNAPAPTASPPAPSPTVAAASATPAPAATSTPAPPTATAAPSPVATATSVPASPTAATTPAAATTTTPVTAAASAANLEIDRVMRHVEMLAGTIGVRAAGTDGEARAADYIADQLAGYGYRVSRQPFPITQFLDLGSTLTTRPAASQRLTVFALQFSAPGTLTAPLVPAGIGQPADFPPAARGAIVLIERGTLTFRDKVRNAQAAGAVAVIIYNNADGTFQGSLQEAASLPTVGLSRDDGLSLRQLISGQTPVEASLTVKVSLDQKTSQNVIGTSANGSPRPIIVIGGHFDSVPAGPGANDNASGTAIVLELARVLAKEQRAELRFIAFGGEELGLLGSRAYVAQLPAAERERIVAMINLDMVAVGPNLFIGGSESLVSRAVEIARAEGLAGNLRTGAGRGAGGSDHASFAAVNVPVAFFNRPDDPNYHTAQDRTEFVRPAELAPVARISLRLVEQLLAR